MIATLVETVSRIALSRATPRAPTLHTAAAPRRGVRTARARTTRRAATDPGTPSSGRDGAPPAAAPTPAPTPAGPAAPPRATGESGPGRRGVTTGADDEADTSAAVAEYDHACGHVPRDADHAGRVRHSQGPLAPRARHGVDPRRLLLPHRPRGNSAPSRRHATASACTGGAECLTTRTSPSWRRRSTSCRSCRWRSSRPASGRRC
jgi:hypothetical protein